VSAHAEDPQPGALRFADLDASIHPRVDPQGYAAELDVLYSSLFATVDWFETHEDPPWMGACVLERPRHVLLFTGKGDTVEVLNKAFVMAPADAERAFQALFRAFPHVRRIRVEVLFPPSSLHCPKLVLFASNHMVVDLPPTADEYRASLGKRMRKTLRQSMNRLARDFPELTTDVFPSAGDDRAPTLFKQLLEWKTARFAERGLKTYWDEYPEMVESFLALLRRRGEVHLTTVSGDSVALAFVFPVGDAICAQESAFDPAYGRYGLGTLSQHWVMCSAISRKYATVNMLWGGETHKSHFAATPRLASAIVVFRDRRAFLSSAQTWAITWRSARRQATKQYWRARHSAGRRLRSLSSRTR
jgi:CelD/BcsL family acetyltransferase involved in cellulose biosynthesis